VEAYIRDLAELDDPQSLKAACEQVGRTWAEARRPPQAVIRQAYRQQLMRSTADIDANALMPNRRIEFERGVDIAWRAYCDEVKRLGREPNRSIFEKWLPR
jgi:hypothetical protein